MAADTIVHRFLKQSELRPLAPAYHVKSGGAYRATSWRDYVTEVKTAARALLALGIGERHRDASLLAPSCVCLLGFNRPEWAIVDLATMAVGGAPAGIYTTSSPSEVAYIVRHTAAKVVLVEDAAQWRKLAAERDTLPDLRHVVTMRGCERIDDPMVLSWEDFLARAAATSEATLQAHVDALDPARLGTLIYTSGTTGPPKGVMLSHANLAWTAKTAADILPNASAADTTLSYLPLSHIAEQVFSLHLPATLGSQVYYAEALDRVPDNLKEVQPTIFFGVPRIWEKLHEKVAAKLAGASGIKRRVVELALSTGREVAELESRGARPSGLLALRYAYFQGKIYRPAKEAMGLARAKMCVSGAAPISPEILRFLAGLDLVIREVYGQSEDTGPTSFNVPGRTRFGSVGPIVPGVEVSVADDEEILVRGPNVFLGYFKEPEATAEALVDGWLRSGDLGRIDAEGFLHITGRKKDLLITAGGKNIAPKNIEAALKLEPLVAEAVVVGDRRKFLTALLSLNPEAADAFAKEAGLDASRVHDSPSLLTRLQAHVDRVNQDLARVEQVKKFTVVRRPFSIEGGELTPTLKVRRSKVNEHYAADIEAMYAE
ncbi:MAG: long-chain fatty acid--CoA ligase [Deltaproteobacteria bacterium]|nr:long-chain fatty acid--CoA ligase [Deltaproteobacteria bacterium]